MLGSRSPGVSDESTLHHQCTGHTGSQLGSTVGRGKTSSDARNAALGSFSCSDSGPCETAADIGDSETVSPIYDTKLADVLANPKVKPIGL